MGIIGGGRRSEKNGKTYNLLLTFGNKCLCRSLEVIEFCIRGPQLRDIIVLWESRASVFIILALKHGVLFTNAGICSGILTIDRCIFKKVF